MVGMPPRLIEELRQQRWFAAKDRTVARAEVCDRLALPDLPDVAIELVRVHFGDGPAESYALVRDAAALDLLGRATVGRELLHLAGRAGEIPTEWGGQLLVTRTRLFDEASRDTTIAPRLLGVEQSNTSLRFDDALILKLYRRLRPGINPELEICRFLTERTSFRNAPQLAASVEYRSPQGETSALVAVLTYVENRGDAWAGTLRRLADVLAGGDPEAAGQPIRRLGIVTAQMHLALASAADDPSFAPQPVSSDDVRRWIAAVDAEVDRAIAALQARGTLVDRAPLAARARGLECLVGTLKIRHHGDYHLGQTLERPDGDFVVIDFEGEPLKPLELRRARASALRDVAGMLRSFDYARHAALRAADSADPILEERAVAWLRATGSTFVDAYVSEVRSVAPRLLPDQPDAMAAALEAFELEKSAYEVLYEINHRPDWLSIPLAAFVRRDPT